MNTYDILKLVFYILICLPILVIGAYFLMQLVKEIFAIKNAENKDKEKKEEEKRRRKSFEQAYRMRRGE